MNIFYWVYDCIDVLFVCGGYYLFIIFLFVLIVVLVRDLLGFKSLTDFYKVLLFIDILDSLLACFFILVFLFLYVTLCYFGRDLFE